MNDLGTKILQKQEELQSLRALNTQLANVTTNFEHLEVNLADLSQGTESIASIMTNWQHVLKLISMANLSLQKYTADDYENFEQQQQQQQQQANEVEMPLPETLVRVEIDNGNEIEGEEQQVLQTDEQDEADGMGI